MITRFGVYTTLKPKKVPLKLVQFASMTQKERKKKTKQYKDIRLANHRLTTLLLNHLPFNIAIGGIRQDDHSKHQLFLRLVSLSKVMRPLSIYSS